MQLVSRKNFLITLAAVMVVAMGIMALSLIQKRKAPKSDFDKQIEQVQTQSESTDIESLEKDLSQTDLSDLDQELQNIDQELEQAVY